MHCTVTFFYNSENTKKKTKKNIVINLGTRWTVVIVGIYKPTFI